MAVRRLNHAVLYVNGLQREVEFYTTTLGFEVRMEVPGRAAFLRSPGSVNDHDLGLFDIGTGRASGRPEVGLYHLAWEVGTLAELVEASSRCCGASLSRTGTRSWRRATTSPSRWTGSAR